MYLKSLVLKGFKSFADRSALALEPGITAVVGPNGSGKSNISDAVLWVLGERNAKNLRGQAMEDVIFAGSSARKPVGIAEVDLVLDNSDGTLPVDFAEVAITRRMYRSGESEYLINGVVARRMDVLDILHDTGLGTGTHSIISQGSLDSILQSKPEDRRALIEEAAGVLKHKQRKAKSERKLEHMDQHLARVKDVAAEVERQLGPLERKAKRARAYQGLSAELSELTLALAVDDLRVLQRAWDEAVGRERALDEELAQKKAAIAEAEARAEELQERIRRESADAGELAKTHRRASSAVERFDGATLLLHEKRRAAQAREAELRVALEAGKARRAAAEAERAQAAAQVGEVRAERERADADVARLAEEHASLTERHRALDREAAALTEARRSAERAQEQARRELATTQESLASGLAHVKLIEGHGKELELQLERSQADAAALAEAAAAAGAALEALAEREAAARGAVSAAFTAREAARTALEEARDEASLLASEIKGLEEVERASAAAGPARAWLLDHADELSCALAPLSHVLRAEAGSEALVERLLGGDVAALLVDEAAGAAAVAAALASCDEQGEVVLVARADAAGPARAAGELPARAAAAAGLGRALVDGLSYPPEAARAVEALLGDVVVCDGLDAALAAHARDASGARFVTEDGCVVWPGGKVTLGAAAADDAEGVLARARRLDGLRARFAEAEASRDAAQQASAAAEEALRQAQGESLRLSQELPSCAARRTPPAPTRGAPRRSWRPCAASSRTSSASAPRPSVPWPRRGRRWRPWSSAWPAWPGSWRKTRRASPRRRTPWCRCGNRRPRCATRWPRRSSRRPRSPSARRTRPAWLMRAPARSSRRPRPTRRPARACCARWWRSGASSLCSRSWRSSPTAPGAARARSRTPRTPPRTPPGACTRRPTRPAPPRAPRTTRSTRPTPAWDRPGSTRAAWRCRWRGR